MPQSCHDSDLGINFLTEISPHEVSWDEHRSDAESVKILYNYSVELSKICRAYQCLFRYFEIWS